MHKFLDLEYILSKLPSNMWYDSAYFSTPIGILAIITFKYIWYFIRLNKKWEGLLYAYLGFAFFYNLRFMVDKFNI